VAAEIVAPLPVDDEIATEFEVVDAVRFVWFAPDP
jgi:hypothetical protein